MTLSIILQHKSLYFLQNKGFYVAGALFFKLSGLHQHSIIVPQKAGMNLSPNTWANLAMTTNPVQ